MNCPNCGYEMEKGFFQMGKTATWTKEERLFVARLKEGDVRFAGETFESHICRNCRNILLDYSGVAYTEG